MPYRKAAEVNDEEDLSEALRNEVIATERAMLATVRELCERAKNAPAEEAEKLMAIARDTYKCVEIPNGNEEDEEDEDDY